MSSLTHRLDRLESDIQFLLLIQNSPNKHQQVPDNSKQMAALRPRSNSMPIERRKLSPSPVNLRRQDTPKRPNSKNLSPIRSINCNKSKRSSSMDIVQTTRSKSFPDGKRCILNEKGDQEIFALKKKLEGEESKRIKLEAELQDLRLLVEQINKEKVLEVHMNKLKKQVMSHSNKRLNEVIKENENLNKNLTEEKEKLGKANYDLKHMKKQMQNVKVLSEKYENLMKLVKEKNENIEEMQTVVKEYEDANNDLMQKYNNINDNLKLITENYNQICATNEELAKSVMAKHKNLETLNSKIGVQVEQFKLESEKNKLEFERLQEVACKKERKLQNEMKINQKLRLEIDNLHQQIIEAKNNNDKSEAFLEMNNKMKKLAEDFITLESNTYEVIEEISIDQQSIIAQYDALNTVFDEKEEFNNLKLTDLQAELEKYKEAANMRENQQSIECEEFKKLITELTNIIKSQKVKVNDLMTMCSKQQELIDTQIDTISQQETELKMSFDTVQDLNMKIHELEVHLKSISSHSMKQLAICNDSSTETEVAALRDIIEKQADQLKCNGKIMEDNATTIVQYKRAMKERDILILQLNKKLVEEQLRRDELCARLKQIHRDKSRIMEAFSKTKKEMDMQTKLIENLEKKLKLEHVEHQLQNEVVLKEKQEAVTAAKFATQKLLETMNDFQRHAESQCQVREYLTNVIQDTDNTLKSTIVQMSSLTLDTDGIVTAIKAQETRRRIRKNEMSYPSSESFLSAKSYDLYSNKSSLLDAASINSLPLPFDEDVRSCLSMKDSDNCVLHNSISDMPYMNSYRRICTCTCSASPRK